MRLSMWILADWMKAYQPEVKILSGKPILRNVRYLTEAYHMSSRNVYIGLTKDFIPSTKEAVICVSEQDLLLFHSQDVEEIFNAILAAFDYYNDWDDSLYELIRENGTLQDLLNRSQEVFHHPLIICDSAHMVLAHNEDCSYPEVYEPIFAQIRKQKFLALDQISVINQELKGKQQIQSPYLYNSSILPFPSWHRNLFYGKSHIGWLILETMGDMLASGTEQLLDILGQAVEYWYEQDENKRELISQADIFLELLSGRATDLPSVVMRLQAMNWMKEDLKLVIKILTGNYDSWIYFSLQKMLPQTFSGCYAVLYETSVVLIANLAHSPFQELEQVLTRVLKQSRTYCGVSYRFTNITTIRQAYQQANVALTYGGKVPGEIYFCEDYVLSYARDTLCKNLNTDIRHSLLDTLKSYDRKHQTEYYETLFQYLRWERNQKETARQMNIHRNTLVYRINRIQELFSPNLDDPVTRGHLMLSYFIEEKGVR